MRSARLVLTMFAILLAASGSVWIGWIYAGPHAGVDRPSAAVASKPDVPRPARVDAVDRFQVPDTLSDLGSLNVVPGPAGGMGNASELNGFPTVSKEAIERAAGYTDRDLPSVEIPFSIEGSKEPASLGENILP